MCLSVYVHIIFAYDTGVCVCVGVSGREQRLLLMIHIILFLMLLEVWCSNIQELFSV